jgi:alpha-N-acetylglucosamine transferase
MHEALKVTEFNNKNKTIRFLLVILFNSLTLLILKLVIYFILICVTKFYKALTKA